DLVVGGGPGGGPRVMILSGADLSAGNLANPKVLSNLFAGDPANRNGIRVSVKDLDGDGIDDLVVGDGTTGKVTGYSGKNIRLGASLKSDFDFDAGDDGGVFVG